MSDSTTERPTDDDPQPPVATPGAGPGSDEAGPPARTRPANQNHEQDLPLDVVFGILKNRRRRLVLRYLAEVSATSTLSELAEHVAAVENDKPVEALSSAERKRVYVGLYQGHLPRLDEADVVAFDDDRGTVAAAENAPQLTRYVQVEDTPSRPRPGFSLAVTAAGGGLFLAQHLLYPSAIASALVIGLLLGTIASVALVHAVPSPGTASRRARTSSADVP